tara:strand:+ start:453 stop:998 length:546 start_codon:yes stop_codon:yes gene_type:complete
MPILHNKSNYTLSGSEGFVRDKNNFKEVDRIIQFKYLQTSQDGRYQVKRFHDDMKGRLTAFFIPSWRPDYKVTATSTNTLTAEGFETNDWGQNTNRHIAIIKDIGNVSGNVEYRKASFSRVGDTTVITYDGANITGIDLEKLIVMNLFYVRFMSDTLMFNQKQDTYSTCVISFKELQRETP